jgi:hypothetical protein
MSDVDKALEVWAHENGFETPGPEWVGRTSWGPVTLSELTGINRNTINTILYQPRWKHLK